MSTEAPQTGYPCPKCGRVAPYTHGAVDRPPWCFCRGCSTMFNPEHTGIEPVPVPVGDPPPPPATPLVSTTSANTQPEPESAPAEAPEPPKERRAVAHRPDPNTPFTAEDLAKLPNWAQGKVRYLNAQLVQVLEALAVAGANPQPQVEAQPDPSPVEGVPSADPVVTMPAELYEILHDAEQAALVSAMVRDALAAALGAGDEDE